MTLVWLLWFLAGSALDILTTHLGLASGLREANPVMREFGEPAMYLLKAAVCIGLSIWLVRFGKAWPLFMSSVIVWLGVLNNVWRLM